MKLSAIAVTHTEKTGKELGFTVKSQESGNLLKVIAKSPGGRFLMVKLTGKNIGKEVLVEDTERYSLVDDVKSKKAVRVAEIKAKLAELGPKATAIENEMSTLEEELETLEEAG